MRFQIFRIFFKNIFFKFLFSFSIISTFIFADSYEYNSYNNHGSVGLINMPTARFYDESVHGVTVYDGTPDQKFTLTSSPFDWMEASFFYTSLQNKRYCNARYDPVCKQDYKDKGFNLKLRLKKEGLLPAIAIGFNDLAGTGYYSSEYIVASYGIQNLDIHLGLGYGTLNDSKNNIKNPLVYLSDNFKNRPISFEDGGGQFQPSRYFSGLDASPFYGISYSLNEKTTLKIERDTTSNDGKIKFEDPVSDYSFGLDYSLGSNFSVGISYERGIYTSLKFTYKNNPNKALKKYKYKDALVNSSDDKYVKLRKNLEENGIGVNKISESSSSIGLELTQFIHPDIRLVEQIISTSAKEAGINKNIKKDLKIVNLKAVSELEEDFEKNSKLIYERKQTSNFNSSTTIKFRPFIAAREEFFKGSLLLENDSELIIRDNLFFVTNLKYSLADNFDNLTIPPENTFPAQVRSDIKDYLQNIDEGILIGRAQFDYYLTLKRNNHLMFSAGILEDMFSGYGLEYIYFRPDTNYAFGAELFNVKKRDYNWGFGTLNYQNIIGSVNFYYRNYGLIPFDMKFSYGEYLAGDIGSTIEFSRSFSNGTKFGVFASNTNVTSSQFGEGSFDKGIFFNIPIYGNFINYTWRPLTKDPGAKLTRRNSLYDLLVRFRPIN